MATVCFEGEETEVTDGSSVAEVLEDMGLPFGCNDGNCGTCMSTIVEGAENLSDKTEKEEDYDLDDGMRLPCQCKINGGKVEFSID